MTTMLGCLVTIARCARRSVALPTCPLSDGDGGVVVEVVVVVMVLVVTGVEATSYYITRGVSVTHTSTFLFRRALDRAHA